MGLKKIIIGIFFLAAAALLAFAVNAIVNRENSRSARPAFAREQSVIELPLSGTEASLYDKILSFIKLKKAKQISIEVVNPRQETGNTEFARRGDMVMVTEAGKRAFRPGRYTIKETVDDNGKASTSAQDFSLGVLAINTDKATYVPGDTVLLQMGAVDRYGHTLCDANLSLEITSPSGAVINPEIKKSGECGADNFTTVPDYSVNYQTREVGAYTMKLANNDTGDIITDTFEVSNSLPFAIKRVGPSRINPIYGYQMTLDITANKNYKGRVVDHLPAGFTATGEGATMVNETGGVAMNWDVDWKAGNNYQIAYNFNAPKISPYRYILGPLDIGDFSESRQWQIASDGSGVKQPIMGAGSTNLYTNTTAIYNQLMGGYSWITTTWSRDEVIPTAGTLSKLYVQLSGDPTNANSSYTFAVMVNGSASALTVTVAAGSISASDLSHSVNLSAGDYVSLRSVAANTPVARTARWVTQFEGSTSGESIVLGNASAINSMTEYGAPGGNFSAATEIYSKTPVPTAGTFKKLYVKLSVSPGSAPAAYLFALRVGGATKNNTLTITGPSTTGNDTAHTDAVNAGDLIDITVVPQNSPTANPLVAWGMVFVSDTTNESLIFGGSYDTPSRTATEYFHLCSSNDEVWNATESTVYSITQAFTLKKFYINTAYAPGAGKSYTLSINSPGGSATGLTLTVSDAATTANDTTHSYAPADGDTASMKSVPSGTPAAAYLRWGIVAAGSVICTSQAGGGNWDNAAKWDCGHEPAAGDAVVIASGANMTVNKNTNAIGSLTINSGATLDTDASARTITLAGDWTNNDGTFTAGSSTVVFNSTSIAQAISGSASTQTFNSITVDKSGQTLSVSGSTATLTSNGALTLTNGTFTAPATINLVALNLNAGTYTAGANTNISGDWTNNGGTFTAGNNTVTFNGTNQTIGGSSSTTFHDVATSGSSNTSTGYATTISGNLSVGNGSTFTAAGYNLTVTGTTTVGGGSSGSFVISNSAGTKIFTGLVTINSGATWNNSGNSGATFRGGLDNAGTFTSGSGVYTFDTNNQNIIGDTTLNIDNLTVTGVTLTNQTQNVPLKVLVALSGSGTLTQDAYSRLTISGSSDIAGLNATASYNTVAYDGATTQTVHSNNYYHLYLLSGAKTLQSGTTAILGNLYVQSLATVTTVGNLAISGSLNLTNSGSGGGQMTIAGYDFSVGGTTNVNTTSIPATLIINNSSGTKTFTGNVTVGVGNTWNNSGNSDVYFGGSLAVNDGTFIAGSGTHYFTGTSKSITSSGSGITVTIPAVSVSGSLTNSLSGSNILSISTALSGVGSLTQGSGANLNLGGTSGITTLVASASGNTVNYNGEAQNVHNNNYVNLTLSGLGNKTFAAATTIAATFTIKEMAQAFLAAGTNSSANSLILSGFSQVSGTWGSSSSSAANKDDAYFAASTGYVTVSTEGIAPNAVRIKGGIKVKGGFNIKF